MGVPTGKVIELLKEYKEKHNNLLVPRNYCTVDGVKLGDIVHNIRIGNRKPTSEERAKLNALGFVWECHVKLSFDEVVELLKEYKKEKGNLLISKRYRTPDGIKLGNIVVNIRTGARKTTLEEKARLNELGFVWKVR